MCNFYKTINEFFKTLFMTLFICGNIALIFGFLYLLYANIFNDFSAFEEKNNLFVFEYIAACAIAIASGVNGADLKKQKKD